MNKNKYQFDYDGDRVELPGGLYAKVKTPYDEDIGPPWKEHDGHGPVTDWLSREKHPGERVLHSDRCSRRYYDFAEAMVIAKRDGWGLGKDDLAELERKLGRKPTRKQIIEAAVERDYEYLRGWCNDEWHWIGVIVTLYDADGKKLGSDSLWGVDDATDYWQGVASCMTENLLEAHEHEMGESAYWAARDVQTISQPT